MRVLGRWSKTNFPFSKTLLGFEVSVTFGTDKHKTETAQTDVDFHLGVFRLSQRRKVSPGHIILLTSN